MPSPFTYAKKRSVPEIAAHMARLKSDERTLGRELHRPGSQAALMITQAQISHTRREKGSIPPKRAGKRRTVKRTKTDRRRRR